MTHLLATSFSGLPHLRAHLFSRDDDLWCIETSIPILFLIHFYCIFYLKHTLLYLPPHYIFFMDYSVLNLGQLLFLFGNEGLKNNIRNIEKINKRIVDLKRGIHFNEIYNYIYIYIIWFVYLSLCYRIRVTVFDRWWSNLAGSSVR